MGVFVGALVGSEVVVELGGALVVVELGGLLVGELGRLLVVELWTSVELGSSRVLELD